VKGGRVQRRGSRDREKGKERKSVSEIACVCEDDEGGRRGNGERTK